MKLKSWLISGAGNDFHVLNINDISKNQRNDISLSDLTKKICFETPADGAIFLDCENDPEIQWNFFNKDGSIAEMCGNATRCVGLYLSENIKSKNKNWILSTVAGKILISQSSEHIYKVVMTSLKALKSEKGFFCNTGVPHLVLPLENFDQFLQLKKSASDLRNDISFKPSGTNVTFVGLTNKPDKIRAVSFERGVEDFTKACGTGAVAAAFFHKSKHPGLEEIIVQMPGGDLKINLTDYEKPIMEGPAVLLRKI